MPTRIENPSGGSQTVLGVTDQFKFNPGTANYKRNRKTSVIHLTKAKPPMATVLAMFESAIPGTRYSDDEFVYLDPGRTLLIQSVSGIGGIAEDTGPNAGYAIPISYIPNPRILASNIHPVPNLLASG